MSCAALSKSRRGKAAPEESRNIRRGGETLQIGGRGLYLRSIGLLALVASAALLVAMVAPVAALSSPPSNAFRYFHDADGRLKAAIDPEGDTAVYNWDAAGNLLSISRHASAKLSIVQLSPQRGEVGATVTIEGTGFSSTPASDTVKFDGTEATVSAASSTSLTVKVPTGATTGTVSVAVGEEGPVASPESFTVTESLAPTVSSILPVIALSGEEVTVSGSHFEPAVARNDLTVNQVHPEMMSASSTALKFKVPSSRLGGHVSVSTVEGSSTGPDLFVPPNGLLTSKVGWTGRFSLGESKTVGFEGSEKVALLLFDGTAGRRVLLSFSESTLTSGPAGFPRRPQDRLFELLENRRGISGRDRAAASKRHLHGLADAIGNRCGLGESHGP